MAPTAAADEVVLVSAIEHWSYCPRQCALIHAEQVFDENVFTLRGRRAHERTDEPNWEMNGTTRIERALPIWSDRLGIYGRADTVEFRSDGAIYPVEYKHGPRRQRRHDDLQLCAQALCLEEMFGQDVPAGAIYHHSTRRRREVLFDDRLRAAVVEAVGQIRQMLLDCRTPPAQYDARCKNCSLLEACAPAALARGRQAYFKSRIYRIDDSDEEEPPDDGRAESE
jgi:CRISPR-associated exonuclease Cas4